MFVKSLKIKIIFLYVIVTICATKEVNNESKIKYGTKLDIRNKNDGTVISNAKHVKGLQVNVPDLRNSKNVNRTTSRSSSRRYEMPQQSTQRKNQHQNEQLPIMQYNIPIVNKNYNNALSYESQRQSTDRTRSSGNASEKLVFKTNAASAITQNTKTKSSHRNNEERRINTRRPANINDNNEDRLSTMPVSRSKNRKTIIPAAETTDTTTTIATSTNRQQQQQKQFANPFEFITQSVWNLFNPQPLPYVTTSSTTPPSTTSRKPPKKYKPAETFTTLVSAKQLANKEEKQNYQKLKTAQSTKTPSPINKHTSTNNNNNTTTNSDGPFRIALPTLFNLEHDKEKRATAAAASVILRQRFECPRESEVRFQLFPKICKTDNDCAVWERDELCCDIFGAKSCVSGVPKPLEEAKHAPILGLIPRKCPTRPLAELWWDVQECHTDMDCWPRVCCPDGRRRYCRTSQPELETVPVPVKRSFNYLTEYLECTAAPPRIFDLHPKACTSTLDCFPNVCCQEAGLRHCRPPKKSLLTLMANFLNVDFVKRLTQNLVIK